MILLFALIIRRKKLYAIIFNFFHSNQTFLIHIWPIYIKKIYISVLSKDNTLIFNTINIENNKIAIIKASLKP